MQSKNILPPKNEAIFYTTDKGLLLNYVTQNNFRKVVCIWSFLRNLNMVWIPVDVRGRSFVRKYFYVAFFGIVSQKGEVT